MPYPTLLCHALTCRGLPHPTPPHNTHPAPRPPHLASLSVIRNSSANSVNQLEHIGVPNALSVFVCAHFDPFRSENKSIEWTVVTNRIDSVNSVDMPYMDMSEFSKLNTCQVYKFWNVELQNVNISKYPWPLDGIIICITLVTLLFLYVFLPFVHLFLL